MNEKFEAEIADVKNSSFPAITAWESPAFDVFELQRKLTNLPDPENLASILLIDNLRTLAVTSLSIGALNRHSEIRIIGEFGEKTNLFGLNTIFPIWEETNMAISIRTGSPQIQQIERLFSGLVNESFTLDISSPITFKGSNIGALRVVCENPQFEEPLIEVLSKLTLPLALYLHIYILNNQILDQELKHARDPKPQLTPRQIKILELMQIGNTTTQISTLLGFSSSTIHQEVILTYRLLGVHKKSEAINRALELELLN